MRRPGLLLAIVTGVLVMTGCLPGRFVYGSGPYRGRVQDADTKRPLAGAAVVAVWIREGAALGPEGPSEAYFNALEVLTDAQGEFMMAAKTHFTLVGRIRDPKFSVYSPGYVPFPHSGTHPQGDAIKAAYHRRVFEFRLPRVTTENEHSYADRPVRLGGVPESKVPISFRLVNQERQRLGLQPIGSPRERSRR
jgi:hypothetical protein